MFFKRTPLAHGELIIKIKTLEDTLEDTPGRHLVVARPRDNTIYSEKNFIFSKKNL
jgi:hypothetical protein